MLFTRTLSDNVYGVDVHIVISDTFDEYHDWLEKRTQHQPRENRPTSGRVTKHEFDNGVVEWYIWFPYWHTAPTPLNFGTLTHEAFHATSQILRDRGLVLSDDSEEAFAYYLANLVVILLGVLADHDNWHKRQTRKRAR